jgi:hypothetical protein
MRKEIIKKALREHLINENEQGMGLQNIDKDILYDFLIESDNEFNEKIVNFFLKALNFQTSQFNINFFKELINLNGNVGSPSDIIVPELKAFEIYYDVYETHYVNMSYKLKEDGWSENDIRERDSLDFDWWNGIELSSEVGDSNTNEVKIDLIKPIDGPRNF